MPSYYDRIGAAPALGALPSEAEFLVHANRIVADAAKANRSAGIRYQLMAARIAEGQSEGPHTNVSEAGRDLVPMRNSFRLMTEGRPDGAPLFAFVVLYTLNTLNGDRIVDSQWWADARYVVTMDSAPMTEADRVARSLLARS